MSRTKRNSSASKRDLQKIKAKWAGQAAYKAGKGRDEYAPYKRSYYGTAQWWQQGWDEAEHRDLQERKWREAQAKEVPDAPA